MRVHDNALKVICWLEEHQPATVAQIAAQGVMNSRDASNAVRYGLQRGALERIERPGMKPRERFSYQLTGQPLSNSKVTPTPSFDGLLEAWGIARTPPRLDVRTSQKFELHD